jgi:Rieske Fe-S protein
LTGGDVGKSIADTAADFDLVVVGNKGMSGSVRMFMGKVPDAVSHLAPCDVLIVNTVDRSLSEVAPGEGAVVTVDGKKVAAFREQDGSPVLLSPRCQHLGCTVGWNEAAGTWDCPCHGSRYDPYGKVIQGPASRDLSPATT